MQVLFRAALVPLRMSAHAGAPLTRSLRNQALRALLHYSYITSHGLTPHPFVIDATATFFDPMISLSFLCLSFPSFLFLSGLALSSTGLTGTVRIHTDPHGSSKRNVSSDTASTASVICVTLYRDFGSPEVRMEVSQDIVIHGTPISSPRRAGCWDETVLYSETFFLMYSGWLVLSYYEVER